jgi:hypothetical protein
LKKSRVLAMLGARGKAVAKVEGGAAESAEKSVA